MIKIVQPLTLHFNRKSCSIDRSVFMACDSKMEVKVIGIDIYFLTTTNNLLS